MSNDTIKNEMRLAALEYLLCQIWVNIIKSSGADQKTFDQRTSAMLASLKRQTFPGLDPEWSDLASGELEEAVERLVEMQREMLGFSKNPK
jgi:hypothetical protein